MHSHAEAFILAGIHSNSCVPAIVREFHSNQPVKLVWSYHSFIQKHAQEGNAQCCPMQTSGHNGPELGVAAKHCCCVRVATGMW